MDLIDYLGVLKKYWKSILAISLAVIALAAGLTMVTKPVYRTSTSIFLSVDGGSTAGELSAGSVYAATQVKSYAQVITSPVVLQPVIDKLDLALSAAQLAEKVEIDIPTGTAIINVSVSGNTPQLVADIANAIGVQTIATVSELSPTAADGTERVRSTVIAPAAVPVAPTSPKPLLNLMVGALLGVALGAGQALLRKKLDTSVVGESDIAEVTDRSVVGLIGLDTTAEQNPLVFVSDPHSLRAEAYRRLRTNVQFLELSGRRHSVVVTSSVAGEGKSSTALNLAYALADAGKSVLLIDADLRRPTIAARLRIEDTVGLTDVLIGRATLNEVTQPVGRGSLQVLASGPVPPNPAELLGSEPMASLLDEATAAFDMVIIDTPPVLPVTDSTLLARQCGGALLVVGSGTVSKPELSTALGALEAGEAQILGLVLNRVPVDRNGRYGYHGHYYSQAQSPKRASADHISPPTESPDAVLVGRALEASK